MRKLFLIFLTLLAAAAAAEDKRGPPAAPQSIEFSIVKTSEASTREAMVFSGGDFGKTVRLQHVAVLVRHPQGSFLFDTGLGRKIDEQFAQDMPLWAKPFFRYGPVTDARTQLEAAGYALPKRIILSHGHWDHASGLVDFPDAEVWISEAEKEFLREPHIASVLPSQIKPQSIKWVSYRFQAKPYRSFAQSFDLFGDGSAVLVPLTGHTAGSAGLFVTLQSGKRFFFIGDAVWSNDAIKKHRPKMWLAGKVVDNDKEKTMESIENLARVQQADPELRVVPAHDAAVHDGLAYFPQFVK